MLFSHMHPNSRSFRKASLSFDHPVLCFQRGAAVLRCHEVDEVDVDVVLLRSHEQLGTGNVEIAGRLP